MDTNSLFHNSLLNITHSHICLSKYELEDLAEEYLKKSQEQKSQKLAYFYLGHREIILNIIAKFNELEVCSQAKSGLI